MAQDFKQLTAWLQEMGIESVPHTQKNYLAHLVAVYHLMQRHGCDEVVCVAGLFHSIYGTEKFQGFKLALERRQELEAKIGPRAERLAFWNCLMDRASMDQQLDRTAEPFVIHNRETGEPMELALAEFDDLCCVHLFDWLEQAHRSRFGLDYRRDAYRRMAERVGHAAEEAYNKVFAPDSARS